MEKRRLFINAIVSVGQILIVGLTLFILYKFLLKTIGIKELGIWSLVLAGTSVSRIANVGISGSVVKFVAKYNSRAEKKKVSEVIQTAAISIALFMGVIMLAGYPLVKYLLSLVVSPESLPAAYQILPFSFLAFWLLSVSGIFLAGLDGYQRIDMRGYLLSSEAVFHLILCFLLVPKYGLMGLAYAKATQNITILFTSWFLLKKYIPALPLLPIRWSKGVFKEIFNYGMNLQILTVSVMLWDPITKGLLSKFGSLSMVGYYEMASRIIQQFRAFIISINQVLVPAVAGLHEKVPEKIKAVYTNSYRVVLYLSLPLYTLLIISFPILSYLLVGHYVRIFIFFGIILGFAWFLNTISAPAYFINLGTGELKWNVISYVTIALINIILGFFLGFFYRAPGVVFGWAISLICGSSIVYLSYRIKHKISISAVIAKESMPLFIVCIASIMFHAIVQYKIGTIFDNARSIYITFFLASIIFIFFCIHPLRKQLIKWAISKTHL